MRMFPRSFDTPFLASKIQQQEHKEYRREGGGGFGVRENKVDLIEYLFLYFWLPSLF